MGGGSWSSESFADYSCSVGRSYSRATGAVTTNYTHVTQAYKRTSIDPKMDPCRKENKIRECMDSSEHPNTIPVILALDVTGSMGDTAMEVSKKLNILITDIFKNNEDSDVEFMVMGIGDVIYDDYPLQFSQFESDIRIAKNLDDIYFESGGGGNNSESYTLAWYVGAYRTKCSCWDRSKKGIIITLGDESLNDTLVNIEHYGEEIPSQKLKTSALYEAVKDKYDLYHIHVKHGYYAGESYADSCVKSFKKVIGEQNVFACEVEDIVKKITNIIVDRISSEPENPPVDWNAEEKDDDFEEIEENAGKIPEVGWA